MSTRFLPTQETVLDNWLSNFSGKVTAAPASYGLTAPDAGVIKAAVDAFHAAFLVALAPTTRTRGAVATKNGEKRNVVAVVRGYAAKVRANDAVSDALKLGLGLKLRSLRGSPTPAPTTLPALSFQLMQQGAQHLRAADTASLGRRGKPPHAAGLVVFRAIGADMAREPGQAQYLGLFTRPAFVSTFTPADRGKIATYFARWVNSKGEAGPWSLATSAAIAA